MAGNLEAHRIIAHDPSKMKVYGVTAIHVGNTTTFANDCSNYGMEVIYCLNSSYQRARVLVLLDGKLGMVPRKNRAVG